MPITPGRVAWYVTGRFYLDEHGKLQDLGYFLHLEGVRAPLFNGAICEAGARLTFRSAPFEAKKQKITNGDISISLDLKGDFSVYLNPDGGGNFRYPDSFSRGTRIAVFRRVSVEMGQEPLHPAPGTAATNVFSADLVESVPFAIDKETYDFRDLLPNGFTQWGTLSTPPLPTFRPFQKINAFTASAVAVG